MRWSEYQESVFLAREMATKLAQRKKGRYILNFLSRNQKIVDLGCNDGGYTNYLHENGFNVIGVDMPKVAANATELYPESRFVGADLENPFPFKTNSFDTIIASEIIEHIINTDNFLSECKRILKPGGILILTTENRFYYIHRFLTFFGIEWEDPFYKDMHVYNYSFNKFKKLIPPYNFWIKKLVGFECEFSRFKFIEQFLPKSFKFTIIAVCKLRE